MKDLNLKLIVIIVLIGAITGCNRTIYEKDLIFSNGKYYKRSSNKPYSGKVTYFFSDGGRKSIEAFFKKGIIEREVAFGYQGELINECEDIPVKLNKKIDANLDRVKILKISEGEFTLYSVMLIVKTQIDTYDYVHLCDEAMKYLEQEGYFSGNKDGVYLKKEGLLVTIHLGELEPQIYEVKY